MYVCIFIHESTHAYINKHLYIYTCVCAEVEETQLTWGLAIKDIAVIICLLLFTSWGIVSLRS